MSNPISFEDIKNYLQKRLVVFDDSIKTSYIFKDVWIVYELSKPPTITNDPEVMNNRLIITTTVLATEIMADKIAQLAQKSEKVDIRTDSLEVTNLLKYLQLMSMFENGNKRFKLNITDEILAMKITQ